jgi:beta-glucanase (GH16 family)
MRAKLPQGKGVWPAFWMLGDNIKEVGWPRCGEIDIMEFVGHTPDAVYGTLHWGKSYQKPEKKSSGKEFKTPRPSDEIHIYAVEWFPDRMDFYYDQTRYHTVLFEDVIKSSGENPFSKPHYIILNLALGGSWGREIDDSILPQKYLVDYVRVYQQQ